MATGNTKSTVPPENTNASKEAPKPQDEALKGEAEIKTEASQERAALALENREQQTLSEEENRLKKIGEQGKEEIEDGEQPKSWNWMPLIGKVAMGAVAAYGSYKITNWLIKKWGEWTGSSEKGKTGENTAESGKALDESKTESSWPSLKDIASGLGLSLGIGLLFKSDDIFEWFQEQMGVKFPKGMKERFMKIYDEKGALTAMKSLNDEVTPDEWTLEQSKTIGISAKTLLNLKDVRYTYVRDYYQNKREKSYLTWGAEEVAKRMDPKLLNEKIPDLPFTDSDDKLRAEREGLKELMEEGKLLTAIANEAKTLNINLEEWTKANPDISIQEILKRFEAEKVKKTPGTEDTGATKEGEESNETTGQTPLLLTADPEEAEKNGMRGLSEIMKRAEEQDSPEEAVGVIVGGMVEHGWAAVKTESGLLITNGITGLMIRLVEGAWDQFVAGVKVVATFASGDYDEGGKEAVRFTIAGAPYLVIGAVSGGVMAAINGKSFLSGASWGGAKGLFLGPISTAMNLANGVKKTAQLTAKGYIATLKTQQRIKENRMALKGLTADKPAWNQHLFEHHKQEYEKFFTWSQKLATGGASAAHLKIMENVDPHFIDEMMKHHFMHMGEYIEKYMHAIGKTNYKFRDHFSDVDMKTKRNDILKHLEEIEKEMAAVRTTRTSLTDVSDNLTHEELRNKTVGERVGLLKESSKQADEYLQTSIREIEAMKKAGKTQVEIDNYTKAAQEELNRLRELHKKLLKDVSANMKACTKEEKALVQKLLTQELSNASGIKAIGREIKGRGTMAFVLGAANLAIGYKDIKEAEKENAIEEKLQKMKNELGLDTLQLMFDIASPFGLSDLYNAYQGKGWISGKELSTWDRGVSILFGTYSLASDALATIGGGVTAEVGGMGGAAIYGTANALEALLRAGGKSPELIASARKLLPELVLLSKEAGGWEKLMPMLLSVKKYTGYGVNTYMAGTIAVAGYSVVKVYYDTTGEEEIPFDFGEGGESVNADQQIETPVKEETTNS